MSSKTDVPDQAQEWLDSSARTFFMVLAFALFAGMILFKITGNPGMACTCGIGFVVIGLCVSVADDGGLGDDGFPP